MSIRKLILAMVSGFLGVLLAATPALAHDYTVKRGDTLSEIAADHGTTWPTIFDLNRDKIEDPDLIFPGQVFDLPGGNRSSRAKSGSSSSGDHSSGGSSHASPLRSGLLITQHYGNPGGYTAGHHTGVDLADTGSDVVQSVRAGRVDRSEWASGWGNLVVVDHGQRESWYAHLRVRNVHVGERVSAGERIGLMGATGNATGPHLHYGESVGGHSYGDQVRPVLLPISGY